MAIIVRPDGSTAQIYVPNWKNVVEHEGRMYRRRRSSPIDLWDDEGPHTTRPKKAPAYRNDPVFYEGAAEEREEIAVMLEEMSAGSKLLMNEREILFRAAEKVRARE